MRFSEQIYLKISTTLKQQILLFNPKMIKKAFNEFLKAILDYHQRIILNWINYSFNSKIYSIKALNSYRLEAKIQISVLSI